MKLTIYGDSSPIFLEYYSPERLSTLFVQAGVSFPMPCGGKRLCRKCKVRAQGKLSPLSPEEASYLTPEEQATGIRYACMTEALGDVEVWLMDSPRQTQIQIAGSLPKFHLLPWGKSYGVAFDIGTTTIAAYLYALKDGTHLAAASAPNPQSGFGADVISRITASMEGHAEALAGAVRGCINQLIIALCEQAKCTPEEIDAVVCAGNTAMEYLLLAADPSSISRAPFQQDRYFGEFCDAEALALCTRNAKVYLTRCISAYVGGDISSGILASEMTKQETPTMLADIGTNGELALSIGGRLICCSTAAGPAFEGAGIHMGMTASAGAISRVWAKDGILNYDVIGDIAPVGICGSGIIDAVSACLELGYIDETGAIDEFLPDEIYQEVDDQPAIRFPNCAVFLTQKDIRAVQLAKSAICSGIETLLHEAGLTPGELGRLLIAGGFGTVLNIRSAEAIGLIPAGLADRAEAIGNSAGMGAVMQLLSRDMLQETETLAKNAETIELSTNPVFRDAYIENMLFP